MARVSYMTEEAAPSEVKAVYERSKNEFGILFNTYRILAQRPDILRAWHDLLGSILGPGKVEPQFKMLAFTAGSQANACLY